MNKKLLTLLSVLVIASLAISACAKTPAPTVAPTKPAATQPVATEVVPTATEAATAEPTAIPDIPIATFDGTSLSVPAEECNGAYTGLIQSVVATDDNTVVFTLCRPDPAFLSKISFSGYAIYPSEWIEKTSGETQRTSEGLEHPIGTGPYMISEWKRGESITFVANPDYWGEAPKASTLVFRWSTDSAARLLDLQAGTIDAFDNVGPDDFETILADPNLQLVTRPALNVFYIGITNTKPPFDNIKVRQALAQGIDRQRIVDNFYPVGSEVASHFTPCSIPNGCVGDPWYDFDAEAAKALLAEAGYNDANPFPKIKLYYRDVVRGYLPQVSNVAQDIQAQLMENLGIEAEIVVMESGAFIEASTSGSLTDGIYLLGWGADYPHITNFLDYHFGAANPQFGTQSPTYTDLLAQGAQIADPAEAEAIYIEANNAIREYVPMIPIAHGGSAVAYRADVVNPQASPLSTELFYASDPGGRDTFVWMQNAEPISLFCADESDGESLRACEQVGESLYAYEINGSASVPSLATACTPDAELKVWTCALRQGVKFHDGSTFDAKDVVATFNMGLNIGSPFHVGNTNLWEYYDYLWGLMKKPGG
ncbi:MAG: ABC transporter substrate-binding protein [Chloroflexota bacterium]